MNHAAVGVAPHATPLPVPPQPFRAAAPRRAAPGGWPEMRLPWPSFGVINQFGSNKGLTSGNCQRTNRRRFVGLFEQHIKREGTRSDELMEYAKQHPMQTAAIAVVGAAAAKLLYDQVHATDQAQQQVGTLVLSLVCFS